jgi:hypothetical protein
MFTLYGMKFIWLIFKSSVHTSQETYCVFITKHIRRWCLGERIRVHAKNEIRIYTVWAKPEFLNVTAAGTQARGKVVPVVNQLSTTPWRRMGEWRYNTIILDLGTRWKYVVSLTPRPLYLLGRNPRCPLNRSLGGLQGRYGRCGAEKILLLLPGIEARLPSA